MNIKAISVILFCAIFKSRGSFVEDYCWRDYDGVVPSDAYKAGIDRDGQPIYIGQVLYNGKLIPGKIHHNKNEIHIEFFEAYTINETMKIFCSQRPGNFEWVKTDTENVLNLKKGHILFEGGYEETVTTYIGRASSFDELTIGKVICWPTYCIPLSTVEQGEFHLHDEFEILTYNPHGKTENTDTQSMGIEDHVNETLHKGSHPSPWWYVCLAFGTISLTVLVILLIRHC